MKKFNEYLKKNGFHYCRGGWRIMINGECRLGRSEIQENNEGGRIFGKTAADAIFTIAREGWYANSQECRRMLADVGVTQYIGDLPVLSESLAGFSDFYRQTDADAVPEKIRNL